MCTYIRNHVNKPQLIQSTAEKKAQHYWFMEAGSPNCPPNVQTKGALKFHNFSTKKHNLLNTATLICDLLVLNCAL